MNWYKLKTNLCPKCGRKLEFNEHEEMIFCKDLSCNFQISQYRMESLVTQMNARKYTAPRDNFSELQNL